MNQYILLMMVLFNSCSTKVTNDDTFKLTRMWTSPLTKTDVTGLYGSDYKQVEGGIVFQRTKSSWPKYAFFFDRDGKVTNQYALLDDDELTILKKNLRCPWRETQEKSVNPHSTQDLPVGDCEKYSIEYEFKKDIGLYEVRWKK